MRLILSVGIGLGFNVTAHAFLNNIFGGDDSVSSYYYSDVSVDNSSHIYIDTRPLEDRIQKLTEATNLSLLDASERDRLTKEYQLDKFGKAIGLDIGKSAAAKMTRTYGVDGLQEIIEDRLFYLRTNQVLGEALSKAITGTPIDKNISRRRSEPGLFNEAELVPVLDAARRRKDLGSFDLYKVLSQSHSNKYLQRPRTYLNGADVTPEEQDSVLAALVYFSKGALDGRYASVDFTGMNYLNLDDNLDALSANAGAFYRGVQAGMSDDELANKIELCKKLTDTKTASDLTALHTKLSNASGRYRYEDEDIELRLLTEFTRSGASSVEFANNYITVVNKFISDGNVEAVTNKDLLGSREDDLDERYDDAQAKKAAEIEKRQREVSRLYGQIQAINDEWWVSDDDKRKMKELQDKIDALDVEVSGIEESYRTEWRDTYNKAGNLAKRKVGAEIFQKQLTQFKGTGYCEFLSKVEKGQSVLKALAIKSVPASGVTVEEPAIKEQH